MITLAVPFIQITLAGAMLGTSLLIFGRMRLKSFVLLFALQSLALASYAATIALITSEHELLIMAGLIVFVKSLLVPLFLLGVARRSGASARLHAYLKPTLATFLGIVGIAAAFITARAALSFLGAEYVVTSVAFSLIVLGLMLLIIRRDLFGQSIGFLVMENGIFLFGLALSSGLPLLVEIGIFLDVLVGFMLMGGLAYRVQKEHHSVGTELLNTLTDRI